MHYIYILYSVKADKYYIGETPNVDTRLNWHNKLGDGFTSRYRPWELKKTFVVENRGRALRIEKYIKKKKRRSFIEKLIVDKGLWIYILNECPAG